MKGTSARSNFCDTPDSANSTREDAKPYLDQIASEDVCEGKLRDYVWMLSYQHALRMCGYEYEFKILGQEILILFPNILGFM